MQIGHLRFATFMGLLASAALAVFGVAPAAAAITATQITSPADPTSVFYDQTTETSNSIIFDVTGTANEDGEVEIRCYYDSKENASRLIREKVIVTGHAFSVGIEAGKLDFSQPCVLRAVPILDTSSHPPGQPDQFQGPTIAASEFEIGSSYGYDLSANGLSAYLEFEPVGACGLDFSNLIAANTLKESEGLFDCDAALYKEDLSPSETPSRSELQIDGANAYSPVAAEGVNKMLGLTLPVPQVAVTKSFDTSTDLVTIHEVDPIVKCAPETVFPPTTTSCKAFVSAGVQLERTWQTSDGNRVASMTDTWRSTDGGAHSLNALYDQETENEETGGGSYRFPGAGIFSPVARAQTFSLPAGPGAIYYKESAATPDGGDGMHPQGAIVYDSPSGTVSFYRGSNESKSSYNGFEMPYQRTIPAGETTTLRMTFIQAYALSEVEALSNAAIASYEPAPNAPVGVTATQPSPPPVATATATQVGSASGAKGQVSFTIACAGASGTSCTLESALSTIEKTRGGKPIAVSAKTSPGARPRSKKLTVGSGKVVIPAGQKLTVTIKLNASGKKLLARFGRLPVHLIVLQSSTGKQSTVLSQNLTVKPAKKKPKRPVAHARR